MTIQRWKLTDPYTSATYTFHPNPNAMTSPFPERNLTTRVTTAVDGAVLTIEGNRIPKDWTFSGDILEHVQYEALRAWVYDRTGRRVIVSDHFGRDIVCVLRNFDPTPKRAIGRYWRHTYTITAMVVSVSAPTLEEVSP